VSEGRDANQREEPYVRQKERKEGVRPARDDEIHKGVKARGMYSTHIPCGDRGYLNNRHHGNASDGGEGEEREDARERGSGARGRGAYAVIAQPPAGRVPRRWSCRSRVSWTRNFMRGPLVSRRWARCR
jgi:hypothetical protein